MQAVRLAKTVELGNYMHNEDNKKILTTCIDWKSVRELSG